MIKGLYRNIIITLSALYAVVAVAFDGDLPLIVDLYGVVLMVLLLVEFIKVLKGDLRR